MTPRSKLHQARTAFGRITRFALCASLFFLSASTACTKGGGGSARPRYAHEYTLVPGAAHHPGVTSALVFPMNATMQREPGLDAADETLQRLVVAHLEANGVESELLSLQDFNRASRVAHGRARSRMLSGEPGKASADISLEQVLPEIVEEVGSQAQILVLPNVLMRTATYVGTRSLKWDGVRRRERFAAGLEMTGFVPAASLYTVIFESSGKRVFSGFGGLDLIFELNRHYEKYDLRADLFEDVENLSEGVCISMHPYLGNDVDC